MLLNKSIFTNRLMISALLLLLCIFSVFATTKPASAASTSQQRSAASLSCPPTLQKGSSGTWVQALQYRLNFEYNWRQHFGDPYGFPNSPYNFHPLLSTDGQFGQNTYNAVRDYQSDHSSYLSVDGVVGNNTWSMLGLCASGSYPGTESGGSFTSCPATLRNGSSGTWVQVLQSRLDTLYVRGIFGNTPRDFQPLLSTDGQFGQHTTNAVWDYQTYWNQNGQGNSVDGVVGPQTWALLGFC